MSAMKIICLWFLVCVVTAVLAHPHHGGGARRRGGPRGFRRRPPPWWFSPEFLRQLCEQIQYPTSLIPGSTTDGSGVSFSFGGETTADSASSPSTVSPPSTGVPSQGIMFVLGP